MLTSKHIVSLDFGVMYHGTKAVKIFKVNGRLKGEDGVGRNPGRRQASFGK